MPFFTLLSLIPPALAPETVATPIDSFPPVMQVALVVWSAIFGGVFGSFLNVVVYRLPRGKSLLHPPSHCPKCGHAIRWYDNVPVFGWLRLNGRCRDCKAPVSARYPTVEAVCGLLFALLAYFIVVAPLRSLQMPLRFETLLLSAALLALLFLTLLAAGLIDRDGALLPKKSEKKENAGKKTPEQGFRAFIPGLYVPALLGVVAAQVFCGVYFPWTSGLDEGPDGRLVGILATLVVGGLLLYALPRESRANGFACCVLLALFFCDLAVVMLLGGFLLSWWFRVVRGRPLPVLSLAVSTYAVVFGVLAWRAFVS